MLKRTTIAAMALAIAATTIALPAAYASPAQTTPTPLPAACFTSSGKQGTLDLKLDNVSGAGNASLTYSSDGSCSGGAAGRLLTIVAGKNQAAANAQCKSVTGGSAIGRVNKDWGYLSAPANYWLCS